MELKTKYNTLQEVWYMRNNKIDKAQIIQVIVSATWNYGKREDVIEECYLLNDGTSGSYDVSRLFPSKEELIDSL